MELIGDCWKVGASPKAAPQPMTGSHTMWISKRLNIAWRSRLKVNPLVDPSPPPRAPHAVWPELRGWNIDLLHMCDACHGNLENSQLPANS